MGLKVGEAHGATEGSDMLAEMAPLNEYVDDAILLKFRAIHGRNPLESEKGWTPANWEDFFNRASNTHWACILRALKTYRPVFKGALESHYDKFTELKRNPGLILDDFDNVFLAGEIE